MAKEIGGILVKLGIDSAEFQKGVVKTQDSLKKLTQHLDRDMKITKAEFGAASAELSKFGKKSDLSKLKADSLAKQLEIQKNIVKSLANEYKISAEKKGEDDRKTQYLNIRLQNSKKRQAELEKAMIVTNKEIEQQSFNIDKLASNMDNVGKKMSSIGTKLSLGVTLPLAAAGKGMLDTAMDAVESENLFEQSMGDMAGSARKWSEDLRQQLGLNDYEVRKNVGTLNVMITSMGLNKEAAFNMSEGLTKLTYDMASFYNLKPEEAFEKLQSGISGETEPLKRLGILVNENTIKTYAYSHGIAKQGDQLTEQQKVMARYGAIMEQTKKAQGDLARTIDSPINQTRIQTQKFKELAIELGEKLFPEYQKFMGSLGKLADWFSNLSDEEQDFVVKAGLVAASLGPMIFITGKLSSSISEVIKLSKSMRNMFTTLTVSTETLNGSLLTLAANPVVLAIGAIAAVIGVIGYEAYKTKKQIEDLTQEIINNYEKEKQAALDTIDQKYKARVQGIDKERTKEEEVHNARLNDIQDEYNKELQSAEDKKNVILQNIQDRKSALDEEYQGNVERIREEYGVVQEKTQSKTDLINEFYDQEIKKATEAHNEKIRMLDEELAKQLQFLDEETRKKVEALQNQIKGIDEQTKKENDALKQRREQEKIANLRTKIAQETDKTRREQLVKELNDELAKIERDRLLEVREKEKEELQNRISEIKSNNEEKKKEIKKTYDDEKKALIEALNDEKVEINKKRDAEISAIQKEREEKEKAEKAKYEASKKRLDDEEKYMNGYVDRYKKKLDEELKKKQQVEDDKYLALKNRIDKEEKLLNEKIKQEKQVVEDTYKNKEANAKQDAADLQKKKDQQYANDTAKKLGDAFSGMNVPAYASGTDFHPGGLAIVGEVGKELVNLPRGSQVIPNNKLDSVGTKIENVHITVKADDLKQVSDVIELFNRLPQVARGMGVI